MAISITASHQQVTNRINGNLRIIACAGSVMEGEMRHP